MNKQLLFLQSLVILVILVSVVQLIVSNSLSTTGVALGKLQDEISVYQKENQILKEQVLMSSSLFHIASEAAKLGFTPEKNIVFLSTPLPIAEKP